MRAVVKHVTILASASALSQLLALLSAPLLARLYTPQEFGDWALFVAFGSLGSAVAAARYETALVLAPEPEEAGALLSLSLLIVTALSLLSLLASLLWLPGVAWVKFAPLLVLVSGYYQVLVSWLTRLQHFRSIGISRIVLVFFTMAGQLGMSPPHGLLWGTLLGQTLALAWVAVPLPLSLSGLKKVAVKYRSFPLHKAPYSLVSILRERLILGFLAARVPPEVVGLFGMAKRVTYMPVSLLVLSLNPVFFRRAVDAPHFAELEGVVVATNLWIGRLATPIMVVSLWNAPELISLVLGEVWIPAVPLVRWLGVVAYSLLFTAWLDKCFDVLDRLRLALVCELTYALVLCSSIWTMLHWRADAVLATAVYASITLVNNAVWMLILFRVAGFGQSGLARLLGEALVLAGLAGLACHLLPPWASLAVLLLYYGFLLPLLLEVLRPARAASTA